jgi:hypothetical protein
MDFNIDELMEDLHDGGELFGITGAEEGGVSISNDLHSYHIESSLSALLEHQNMLDANIYES